MAVGGPPLRSRVTATGVIWFAFAFTALLLLDVFALGVWATVICVAALVVALAVPAARPSLRNHPDTLDLVVVAAGYLAVVGAFRLAFIGFTTDSVLGLFLSFATGLILGVAGPVIYQVWIRERDLRSLGIGLHHLPETLVIGVTLGLVQFAMTLWGYDLPAGENWIPLLVMSLVVGLFEAVFFRGFIQGRLEASFGSGPAVAGAAVLYALYHFGYGMELSEMWFLFGLGVVYAIIFRLVNNILVLWPLLTPLGAFFNNLETGDIDLPWASIAGFAEVGVVMAVVIWLAHRHIVKHHTESIVEAPRELHPIGP